MLWAESVEEGVKAAPAGRIRPIREDSGSARMTRGNHVQCGQAAAYNNILMPRQPLSTVVSSMRGRLKAASKSIYQASP